MDIDRTCVRYAAVDLSSRVHDLINATSAPSSVNGLRAAMGR